MSDLPFSPEDAATRKSVLHDARQIDAFQDLTARIHACKLCPRMEGRTRVFGHKNGSIDASVLFVAEAPGRFGADRSGIPLAGDQTGHHFESLLLAAQLQRSEIFITNAVLCNPRNEQGYNAPPTAQEVVNCSAHLCATIQLLQPRFVVSLGQVALRALDRVAHHELLLSQHVGLPHPWYGRWLIALYHPSPRTQIYRSRTQQREDFQSVGAFIRAHSSC